ncbi:MAG: hypothetical protein CMJ76_10665 [Planctomycetaceae bacterium]|nr:hypothetical protein [Planctomycetaceae bacterium]
MIFYLPKFVANDKHWRPHVGIRYLFYFLVPYMLTCTSLHADEFFEKKVRPLLVAKCYQCHAGTKTSGGLALDTKEGWAKGGESGAAIVPGDIEASLLIDAINYKGLEMPPADEGGKLTSDEIAILTFWVKNGAVDPRITGQHIGGMSRAEAKSWWAYQPVSPIDQADSPELIDIYINRRLQQHGLEAQDLSTRRELIRRATYDLTGLPPTYEEVVTFQQDPSPHAFRKVVDRLLASDEYGEHWGRHWLDVIRYADTAGENSDRPLPHAWRYRNWVIQSINQDIAFTDFVQQQLAGDLRPLGESTDHKNDGIIATGYLAVSRRYGHDINKDIHLMHEDVIDNVGKAFLGMTIGCARCHDHKYDPITANDYYAIYGIFSSTNFSFPGCEPIPQPSDLIPLTYVGEQAREYETYLAAKARYDANRPNNPETIQNLKDLAAPSLTLLATANVGQNGNEKLEVHLGDNRIHRIKKDEVLQLRINRNGNYGADTTGIRLNIQNKQDPEKNWSSQELIALIDSDSPFIEVRGARWAFLDPTNGPKYLVTKRLEIGGHAALKGWAFGDNPSFYANTSNTTVSAWTTLPPQTLFTHPGPNEDAAIAWICPEDGEYEISGHVLDGHRGAGDGVTFYIEHIQSAVFGNGLAKLGNANGNLTPPTPLIPPVAYAVTEGTVADAPLQIRGDPEQPGDNVQRRWLEVFGGTPLTNPQDSGRLELAHWVTAHPLFARVLANRIWQWHFGSGIVSTSNDFGSRGAAPTHPQLLEFLAGQVIANGYQLKPLHRLIMQSDAYQRSSHGSELANTEDPSNQLLSHFTPRRLSAEEIRDSLLLVSKELDTQPGQHHPFPPETSWNFSQHAPFNAVYATNKRSVYMMVQRQRRHPFLALFDGPDPNASTPVRGQTTVPTQALYFLNDEFFHSSANLTATIILASERSATTIEEIYQLLFQRMPTAAETDITLNFVNSYDGTNKQKWQAITRVLLSSNEFLYVD